MLAKIRWYGCVVCFLMAWGMGGAYAWGVHIQDGDVYLVSDVSPPHKPLEFSPFPVNVFLYYSCADKTFVLHNDSIAPLASAVEQRGGNLVHKIAVQVDESVFVVHMYQRLMDSFYHFLEDSAVFINADTTILVELQYVFDGVRHYYFDMTGFDIAQCDGKNRRPPTQKSPTPPDVTKPFPHYIPRNPVDA